MATEIKIHRGGQIGGCVTEISAGKARILIDFGEDLPGSKNKEKFEFPWDERPVGAVFFTHYHSDHIGRFTETCQHTDVYMSELSREVLVNIHGYLAENLPKLAKWKPVEKAQLLDEARKHAGALEILKGAGQRVHTFRPHEKKTVSVGDGDIRVTPFWVDHSAADACMLLIETEDKRILHTGDFRGHGIQGEDGMAMYEAVRSLAEERTIDTLIIEGTMMSRQGEKPYSEDDLRRDTDRLFQKHKQVFLIISSTNLDSFQTFYRAAVKWKRHVYVYNVYLKSQLETLGRYASQRWDMPAMEDVKQIKGKSPEQLKNGFVAIIKANVMGIELVKRFGGSHPVVVYSMWPGYYLRKLDTALCDFVEVCKKEHIPVYPLTDNSYGPLHTSGHASLELIEQVINAAKPRELFPIHTEDAWGFLDLDIPEELKETLQDRMLQAGEMSGYSQEADHRYLSDASLAKFLPDGSHRAFVDLVKEYPKELSFCFRGNSGNAAIIYYKNHVAFHITARGYVKFNFDHARFITDEIWATQRKNLSGFGYSFEKKQTTRPKDGSESVGYVTMPPDSAKNLTLEELKELYEGSIREMIDSFFLEKKLTEKQVQQKLFLACKETVNGYCFYDMEFSQPYGKILNCKNQPDILDIRFDRAGKPERLVFVEVKSKPEALGRKSGLDEHVRGMEDYPDWLLPIRGRDAYHILMQYIELGLMKKPLRPFIEAEFEKLSKEILLILTGDAVDALKTAPIGESPLEDFLKKSSYQPLTGMLSSISLDGDQEEPMAVYRKDVKKGTAQTPSSARSCPPDAHLSAP